MTETAMQAALERAGYRDKGNSLYVLACQMLSKSGMSIARCKEALEQAWVDMRKPGEDQRFGDAQKEPVHPRQDDGSGGQISSDVQADVAPAAVTDEHSGAGHTYSETQRTSARSAVVQPHRMPRGITSIAGIQKVIEKAVIFRLADSRDIMGVKFYELARIERKAVKNVRVYGREAIVARYLIANVAYANPDPFAKVGDLFPIKTIEAAVAEAEKERPDAA